MTTAENLTSTAVATGAVTLGTTTYSAERLTTTWTEAGVTTSRSSVYLNGPRGSRFLVRPFLYRKGQTDTGIHQVINLKSGAELRSKGNLIRVIMVGDIIEEAK
jgi:hypothetical protein